MQFNAAPNVHETSCAGGDVQLPDKCTPACACSTGQLEVEVPVRLLTAAPLEATHTVPSHHQAITQYTATLPEHPQALQLKHSDVFAPGSEDNGVVIGCKTSSGKTPVC
jgi:hypothetical protein